MTFFKLDTLSKKAFLILIAVYSLLVLCRAWDPIRTKGDFFGDEFAYQSAVHFGEAGFLANYFLMNRNYGPVERGQFYDHHAGFYSYAYGLAYRIGIRDLWFYRCIAYFYFLILIAGLYFLIREITQTNILAFLSVAVALCHPIIFYFSDILEGTAYLTPFVFWILYFFHTFSKVVLTKKQFFKPALVIFLLSFLDARFSHASVIYLFAILISYQFFFFDKQKVFCRAGLFLAFLAGAGASTLLYFYQAYLINHLSLSGLLDVMWGVVHHEQDLSERINSLKCIYYFFLTPPHFILILFCSWLEFQYSRLKEEVPFRTSCLQLTGIVFIGEVFYFVLFSAKALQHAPYFLPLAIFALSIWVGFWLLFLIYRLETEKKGKVALGVFALIMAFGIHWGWLENQNRLLVPFKDVQIFESKIPKEGSLIISTSVPALHHYLKRNVINHNDSVLYVRQAVQLIGSLKGRKEIYFLYVGDPVWYNPTQALVLRMLNYYASLLPGFLKERALAKLAQYPMAITIEQRDLERYLTRTYPVIFRYDRLRMTLFRIR